MSEKSKHTARLLSALKTLLEVYENKDKKPGWVKRLAVAKSEARAALRKAEGRTV